MQCFISAVYKQGVGVTVEISTQHINAKVVEDGQKDATLYNQLLQGMIKIGDDQPHEDKIAVIYIEEDDWKELDSKPSVGDLYNLEVDANGIRLEVFNYLT